MGYETEIIYGGKYRRIQYLEPRGVARLKNGKNERPSNLCAYTKNEKKKSVDGLFEKTVKKTVNALLRIHSIYKYRP